jgi:CHASE3 domain sensor protein
MTRGVWLGFALAILALIVLFYVSSAGVQKLRAESAQTITTG